VKLALFSPRGEKLVEVNAANYVIDNVLNPTFIGFASAAEAESLSFKCQRTGPYRLEVSLVQRYAAAGTYILKIEDLRPVKRPSM